MCSNPKLELEACERNRSMRGKGIRYVAYKRLEKRAM